MVVPHSTSQSQTTDEAIFQDSTNALSHNFTHLSVDDADVFADLPRVSSGRDTLTDDDHKALDATILTTFSANLRHNEEPPLPSLFGNIANNDTRLLPLTTDDATTLLQNEPLITIVLRNAWRKGVFREVRRLCAFSSPPSPYLIH